MSPTVTTMSDEFMRLLREQLTDYIHAQPEFLLEHTGGPLGLEADIILATLIGFDDQVDAEIRITTILPVIKRAIPQRPSLSLDAPPLVTMPTARYDLQSNWAEAQIDWLAHRHLLPEDVHPSEGDMMIKVALVRYKRQGLSNDRSGRNPPNH